MTIFDAYSHLLNFFAEKDLFSLETDYKDLLLVTTHDEADNKLIIAAALDMMSTDGIVKPLNKKSWVLIKKLEQLEQNIKINGVLAMGISNLINRYCDSVKDEVNKASSLNLNERDLANLLILATPKESSEET